jgi:hypothetical protein
LPIPLDHPALAEGWWQPERHGPITLRRWTNGNALLPIPGADPAAPGVRLLEVEILTALRYSLPLASTDRGHVPTEAAA